MRWPDTPEMAAINRRRDAIHISSLLYYQHNMSMYPDWFYDQISRELVELHAANPELVRQGYEWEMFEDWDGSTGYHLPSTPRAEMFVRMTMEKLLKELTHE